jgi:uncharacterized protein YuzE
MKLEYDPKSGAFTLRLNDKKSAKSKMITDDCILKFDAEGNVIALEILDATRHGIDYTHVEMVDVTDPALKAERLKRIKERSEREPAD